MFKACTTVGMLYGFYKRVPFLDNKSRKYKL